MRFDIAIKHIQVKFRSYLADCERSRRLQIRNDSILMVQSILLCFNSQKIVEDRRKQRDRANAILKIKSKLINFYSVTVVKRIKSTIRIQCAFKRFLAGVKKKAYSDLRNTIKIQSYFRRFIGVNISKQRLTSKRAEQLQATFKRFLAERLIAAIKLQSVLRGRIDRIKMRRILAVVMIQTKFRNFLATKTERIIADAELKVQEAQLKEEQRIDRAAATCQKVFRTWTLRSLFLEIRQAATMIQKTVRGHIVRKAYTNVIRSIVRIQTYWRLYRRRVYNAYIRRITERGEFHSRRQHFYR